MIDSAIRKAFQFEIGGNPVTLKLEIGVSASGIGPSDPISREPGARARGGAPIFDFRPEAFRAGPDDQLIASACFGTLPPPTTDTSY